MIIIHVKDVDEPRMSLWKMGNGVKNNIVDSDTKPISHLLKNNCKELFTSVPFLSGTTDVWRRQTVKDKGKHVELE